jgi:hypothetical protein
MLCVIMLDIAYLLFDPPLSSILILILVIIISLNTARSSKRIEKVVVTQSCTVWRLMDVGTPRVGREGDLVYASGNRRRY